MPAVVESHSAQIPVEARRRLTREDCKALEAAGLLEWERFELIDGGLIPKMPKSRLHSNVLRRLCERLRRVFGIENVDQEVPIDLNQQLNATNQPEPDVIVLRQPAGELGSANPEPPDLFLVAEISATTQDYDLGAKAALYATAGIIEYWGNRSGRHAHRGPSGAHGRALQLDLRLRCRRIGCAIGSGIRHHQTR